MVCAHICEYRQGHIPIRSTYHSCSVRLQSFTPTHRISYGKLLHSINGRISRLSSFHEQYRAFASIVAGYEALNNEEARNDDAKLKQIEAWAKRTYMRRLQHAGSVDRQDGLHLADLVINQAAQTPLSE